MMRKILLTTLVSLVASMATAGGIPPEAERLSQMVHVQRLLTTGLAKLIFIKREFEADNRISDIRPEGDHSSEPSMERSSE